MFFKGEWKLKKFKFITVLVSLFVLFVAAGCSSTSTTESQEEEANTPSETVTQGIYTDGTYEATSDAGVHPGLKVSVVVKDGNISEVSVLEHSETEGIGVQAIEKIPTLIVENQSTEVDSVTGASKTSEAIKEAVNTALSEAK